MKRQSTPKSDRYAVSLGGITTMASFTFVPAIDNTRINDAWDHRLGPGTGAGDSEGRRNRSRELESWLARYFAPGRCNAR